MSGKLMPAEITPEMHAAWQKAFNQQLQRRTSGGRVGNARRRAKYEPAEVVAYRAMYAAAPASVSPALITPENNPAALADAKRFAQCTSLDGESIEQADVL